MIDVATWLEEDAGRAGWDLGIGNAQAGVVRDPPRCGRVAIVRARSFEAEESAVHDEGPWEMFGT